MKYLYLIPARGGSKGIPNKNIKSLKGKPLIVYTIDCARKLTSDINICVSTDSLKIKKVVESQAKLKVPFLRNKKFATDKAGMYEVIIEALNYYEKQGVFYDAVVLLQPTSPLRAAEDVKKAQKLFSKKTDMIVSVKEADKNPYFNAFVEKDNMLVKLFNKRYLNRQEAPIVYQYNGAIYIINTESLKKAKSLSLKKVKKYVMSNESSVDIDSLIDWNLCELLLKKKFK
ncbi:MAG: acylneuraminate cytidylyltransferase family protein [Bacteroidetes bacterium]|nr:acylneuraminate cytidylyltransferase family protein [Bacteroidota bacterium]